jgi:hypothetical protein
LLLSQLHAGSCISVFDDLRRPFQYWTPPSPCTAPGLDAWFWAHHAAGRLFVTRRSLFPTTPHVYIQRAGTGCYPGPWIERAARSYQHARSPPPAARASAATSTGAGAVNVPVASAAAAAQSRSRRAAGCGQGEAAAAAAGGGIGPGPPLGLGLGLGTIGSGAGADEDEEAAGREPLSGSTKTAILAVPVCVLFPFFPSAHGGSAILRGCLIPFLKTDSKTRGGFDAYICMKTHMHTVGSEKKVTPGGQKQKRFISNFSPMAPRSFSMLMYPGIENGQTFSVCPPSKGGFSLGGVQTQATSLEEEYC